MALSDSQIERYSRQIIVPEVGGRGQERLLAARLVIAGEIGDLAPVLAYMAGAGVGEIFLHAGHDRSLTERMITDMRELNSDAKILAADDHDPDLTEPADLVLILAGTPASPLAHAGKIPLPPGEGKRSAAERAGEGVPRSWPLILARLDSPGKIAVMTSSPPCPACADADLLAPFGARAETAGLIAMVAAVEAFKILTGRTLAASALLEFDGYRCVARELKAGPARCGCAAGDAKLR